MKLPDNIKMIFFDFDDTLFVHYSNQRFGNDDKIMKELEKSRTLRSREWISSI